MMNAHRFYAPGRMSNWEMAWLRQHRVWRSTRWIMPWSSLSEGYHPASQQDWTDRR
jgi:hypothetical protein